MIPESINITESCNNEYWRAPAGAKTEIIIDMGCSKRLETFSIMNGFGDFGTKEFSLFGSRELNGPWQKLYTGKLPQGMEMTEEVSLHKQSFG